MSVIALISAGWVVLTAATANLPTPLPEGASAARLAIPVVQPVERLIDGRDWTCAGALCTAGHQDTADSQPLWMECSDAAAELGAFTEYRTGSETLEPAKLVRCNAHAGAASRR